MLCIGGIILRYPSFALGKVSRGGAASLFAECRSAAAAQPPTRHSIACHLALLPEPPRNLTSLRLPHALLFIRAM